jgi:hypothetical protein
MNCTNGVASEILQTALYCSCAGKRMRTRSRATSAARSCCRFEGKFAGVPGWCQAGAEEYQARRGQPLQLHSARAAKAGRRTLIGILRVDSATDGGGMVRIIQPLWSRWTVGMYSSMRYTDRTFASLLDNCLIQKHSLSSRFERFEVMCHAFICMRYLPIQTCSGS